MSLTYMKIKSQYKNVIFILLYAVIIAFECSKTKLLLDSAFEYKKVHISFDDVFVVLQDLQVNQDHYDSVFDNPLLKRLKDMHHENGAMFTFYVYEKNQDFNYDISRMTSKFRDEFKTNSNWLKFGFHSIEPSTSFDSSLSIEEFIESYNRVHNEIIRFAGEESVAKVLRLNYFRGSDDKIDYLSSQGITGLLCADDDRISYNLSDVMQNELKVNGALHYNGMNYYNTSLRLDKLDNVVNDLTKIMEEETLILFAHEWALSDDKLNQLELALKWLVKNKYTFTFLE